MIGEDAVGDRGEQSTPESMGDLAASFAACGRQNKDEECGVQGIVAGAPVEANDVAYSVRGVIKSDGDANVTDTGVGKRGFSESGDQLDSNVEPQSSLRLRNRCTNIEGAPQPADAQPPQLTHQLFAVESPNCSVRVREARLHDFAAVASLLRQHLRSLVLPCVFFWICGHARDFGSLVLLMILLVQPLRAVAVVISFLLVLVLRAFWELEQYAVRGCADLAAFETTYLNSAQNQFLVAEVDKASCKKIIGCIGVTVDATSPQSAHLVRLLVASRHRGLGIGSQLLSASLAFAASKKCLTVDICINSLNASGAKFLRNRGFELVSVDRRNLLRGDLLRWRVRLDSDGRLVEPNPASI